MPSCSVVVCTRDRLDQLERCLSGIRTLCYPEVDVLVVHNAARDEKTERLARLWNARYLSQPIIGVSRCRNYGARHCTSEIVAFIDDDAVAVKDWLCNIALEFSDPKVMAVTGLIHPLNSNPFGGAERYLHGRTERRVFDSSLGDWFTLANFGAIGDASNMAFRREVFNRWPGFNERLGLGTSVRGSAEHNAFFELIKRGHRIVYTPVAVVHHPFPETAKGARERWFRCLEGTFAYIAYLFVEEPAYRQHLTRFLTAAVARRFRRRNPLYSRRHEMSAFVSGLRQYFRFRQDRHPSKAFAAVRGPQLPSKVDDR